ncbi:hypothetical protein DFH06DRAFT_1406681 [Mycena polygramma]|nr:hypothetical protein DFH06DRAFT_1406681 [Mycena polygramma]
MNGGLCGIARKRVGCPRKKISTLPNPSQPKAHPEHALCHASSVPSVEIERGDASSSNQSSRGVARRRGGVGGNTPCPRPRTPRDEGDREGGGNGNDADSPSAGGAGNASNKLFPPSAEVEARELALVVEARRGLDNGVGVCGADDDGEEETSGEGEGVSGRGSARRGNEGKGGAGIGRAGGGRGGEPGMRRLQNGSASASASNEWVGLRSSLDPLHLRAVKHEPSSDSETVLSGVVGYAWDSPDDVEYEEEAEAEADAGYAEEEEDEEVEMEVWRLCAAYWLGRDGVERENARGEARSYCATSGRYGTNAWSSVSASAVVYSDAEEAADAEARRSSGMRYSGELGRVVVGDADAEERRTNADARLVNFLRSVRTPWAVPFCSSRAFESALLRWAGAERNGERRRGSGESRAAETRLPNSRREKGGARADGDEGRAKAIVVVVVGVEKKEGKNAEREGSRLILLCP